MIFDSNVNFSRPDLINRGIKFQHIHASKTLIYYLSYKGFPMLNETSMIDWQNYKSHFDEIIKLKQRV